MFKNLRAYKDFKALQRDAAEHIESDEFKEALVKLFKCKTILQNIKHGFDNPYITVKMNALFSTAYTGLSVQENALVHEYGILSDLYKNNAKESALFPHYEVIFIYLMKSKKYEEAILYGDILLREKYFFSETDVVNALKVGDCFFFLGKFESAVRRYEVCTEFLSSLEEDEIIDIFLNERCWPGLINNANAYEKIGLHAEYAFYSHVFSSVISSRINSDDLYEFSEPRLIELTARLAITIDGDRSVSINNYELLLAFAVNSSVTDFNRVSEFAILALGAYLDKEYSICLFICYILNNYLCLGLENIICEPLRTCSDYFESADNFEDISDTEIKLLLDEQDPIVNLLNNIILNKSICVTFNQKQRMYFAMALVQLYWKNNESIGVEYLKKASEAYENSSQSEYIDDIYMLDTYCKLANSAIKCSVYEDFMHYANKIETKYADYLVVHNQKPPLEISSSISRILLTKSGELFHGDKNYVLAINTARKAIDILESYGWESEPALGTVYNRLSEYYELIGANDIALKYAKTSLDCGGCAELGYDAISRRVKLIAIKTGKKPRDRLFSTVKNAAHAYKQSSSYDLIEGFLAIYASKMGVTKIPFFTVFYSVWLVAVLLRVVFAVLLHVVFNVVLIKPLVFKLWRISRSERVKHSKNMKKYVKFAYKIGEAYRAYKKILAFDYGNPLICLIGESYNNLKFYNDTLHILLTYYSRLPVVKYIENPDEVSKLCLIIGDAFKGEYKYAQALEYYNNAILHVSKQNNEIFKQANFSIGETYFELGAYQKAKKHFSIFYKKSKELINITDKQSSRVMIYMARILLEEGHTPEARRYLQNALDNFGLGKQRRHDKTLACIYMVSSYLHLPILDYFNGDKKIEEVSDRVLDLYRDFNRKTPKMLYANEEFGWSLNLHSALNLLDTEKYRNSIGDDKSISRSMRQYVGLICKSKEDEDMVRLEFALDCFSKARKLLDDKELSISDKKLWGLFCELAAEMESKNGNFAQAISYYCEALEEREDYYIAHHVSYLNVLHKLINLSLKELAGTRFNELKQQDKDAGIKGICQLIHTLDVNYTAHIIENMSIYDGAIRDAVLHKNEAYVASVLTAFLKLREIGQHLPINEIYNFVLRTKYVSSESALQISNIEKKYPDYAEKIRLRNELIRKTHRTQDEDELLETFNKEIASISFQFDFYHHLEKDNAELISASLKDGEVLIEYKHIDCDDGNKYYYAFILYKKEIFVHNCGCAVWIDDHVLSLYADIIKTDDITGQKSYYEDDNDTISARTELTKCLFGKINIDFTSIKKIFIALDGELFKLPFELLYTDSKEKLSTDSKEKLSLVDYGIAVSYVSTGRSLVREKAKPEYKDALVIANPRFDLCDTGEDDSDTGARGNKIKELRYTAIDLEIVSKEISEVVKKDGKKASKNEIIKTITDGGAKSILHIATHGFALSDMNKKEIHDYPIYRSRSESADELNKVGLLLAGADSVNQERGIPEEYGDAILDGNDILSLDLRGTSLLVLSACQTGLGFFNNANGIKGLRYVFEMAGVKIIVCTLWKVDDFSSAMLMSRFYSNISKGDEVVQALSEAKKFIREATPDSIMKDIEISENKELMKYWYNKQPKRYREKNKRPFSHPYHWAGFILQGK